MKGVARGAEEEASLETGDTVVEREIGPPVAGDVGILPKLIV